MLIIDGDRFVDFNQSTLDLLGYETREDLFSTHPSSLSPPTQPDGQSSFDKANKMISVAMETGSNRFEWIHKKANGENFPVEVLLTRIDFDARSLLHVVWRDITKRKALQAEVEAYQEKLEKSVFERTEKLRKSEQALKDAQRIGQIGSYEWDITEDRLKDCSEEYARIQGLSKNDLLRSDDTHIEDITHPDDLGRVLCEYEESKKTGKSIEMEYRIVKPDGEVRYILEKTDGIKIAEDNASVQRGTIQDITVIKQAEARLHENEQNLLEAQRIANVGSFVWDVSEGKIISCSAMYARIHGLTVEDILSQNNEHHIELTHPDDIERLVQTWIQSHESGHGFSIEYRIFRPDGELRYLMEIAEQHLKQNDGRILQRGVVQDITDRKNAENILMQNQAMLKQAMRTASMGAWIWDDVKDESVFCSEELAALFKQNVEEYQRTRAQGEGIYLDLHPEDRERYRMAVLDAAKTKTRYSVDFREKISDGTYRYFREVGEPAEGILGEQDLTIGIVQDITEQKQIEEELRSARGELEVRVRQRTNELKAANHELEETKERLEHTASMSRMGFWEWNEIEDHAHYLSPYYFALHGLEDTQLRFDQITSEVLMSHVHPDDRERVASELWFKEGGNHFDTELRVIKSNGEITYLNAVGHAVRDDGGRLIKSFGTIRDVTKEKKTELQLVQSSKLASLGEMATGIAHELNQPLNVMRMSIDTLNELNDDDELTSEIIKKHICRTSSQIDRAATIINHMRIFGREASDEMSLISAVDAVTNATDFIGEQLKVHNIDLSVELPGICRPVMGHPTQLEQVVLNLLSNSRDAIGQTDTANGRQGHIMVKVNDNLKAEQVDIVVQDNGGGIPENVISNVFDPFFTTKEVGQGTGVGLSISYGIVKNMGGEITVKNINGGSEFTITLPTVAQ